MIELLHDLYNVARSSYEKSSELSYDEACDLTTARTTATTLCDSSHETRTRLARALCYIYILARSDRFHSIKMPPKRKIRGNIKRRNVDGQGDQESQPEETTSPATTTTTPAAAAASATPQGLTHHLLLCLSYICLLLINIPNNITSLCWGSLLLFSKGSKLCGGIGLAGRKVLCDKIAGSYNTRKWSYNTLWP